MTTFKKRLRECVPILTDIPLIFVADGPDDNNSSLFKIVAWRRAGSQSLPQSKVYYFFDAIWRKWAAPS